jgi:hypothetical protein
MGAYSNPQGFIDTQTGQHFRDLQANIAGAVSGFAKLYKEKRDQVDLFLQKQREQNIKNQQEVDDWSVKQMGLIQEASAKNSTVDWNETYKDLIKRAADIKLAQLKGNLDPELRKEYLAIQSSVGDYVNGLGNLSSMNETLGQLKTKGYGVEGGLSNFNNPEQDKALKLLSGELPGGKKEAKSTYDPQTGTMKQVMTVYGSDGFTYNFDMATLNSLSNKPSGFFTIVPETSKAIETGNQSLKALEITQTNAKGEAIPTGVLQDGYKNSTKSGVEGDITWVNGIGTKRKKVTKKVVVGDRSGKAMPDQWEEETYQAYDIDKLTGSNSDWETNQKAQAAALFVEPNTAKSGWYESIRPALRRALDDKTLPSDQIKRIEGLLSGIDMGEEEAKTRDFNPVEKDITMQGYMELARISTQKAYGMKLVDKVTIDYEKPASTGGSGSSAEPKSPGVMNLYTKKAAQEYFKRALGLTAGLDKVKGKIPKEIMGKSVALPDGLMINGSQVKNVEIVLNPNAKFNNVRFDILGSDGMVIEENIDQNTLNSMFKGSISATKGDIAARKKNELQ